MKRTIAEEKTPFWILPAASAAVSVAFHAGIILVLFLSTLFAHLSALFTQPELPGELSTAEVMLATPFDPTDEKDITPLMEPEPFAKPFVVQNNLPTDMLHDMHPDEKKLNALQDIEEGGTELRAEGKRSGGGGGDGAVAQIEGHVRTADRVWARMKWKPDPGAKLSVPGDETGRGESIPGTLQKPGAGDGLGNGKGSGALASQGSGTGAGAGINGSNIGSGLGTAPAIAVTQKPAVLSMNRGAYPTSARVAHHEGTVMLNVEILPSGEVGTVDVRTSSGYEELDQAAKSAAKDWRFTGALRDGKPVRFWYAIPFRFELTNQ